MSSSRMERAEAIVRLLEDAPRIPGESFWSSIALHLVDAGYTNTPEKPLTVVVQPKPAPQVPEPIIANLKRLQTLSSQTKRGMPSDHEFRKAGDELARYAVAVMERYEVSAHKLSQKMGLSGSTLTNFLVGKGVLQKGGSADGKYIPSTRGSFPDIDIDDVEELPHVTWKGCW